MKPMYASRLLPFCILALCALAPAAHATNPAYAKRTRVGTSPGTTNMARADVSRSGLSATALLISLLACGGTTEPNNTTPGDELPARLSR